VSDATHDRGLIDVARARREGQNRLTQRQERSKNTPIHSGFRQIETAWFNAAAANGAAIGRKP